jgi:hypothetical protein
MTVARVTPVRTRRRGLLPKAGGIILLSLILVFATPSFVATKLFATHANNYVEGSLLYTVGAKPRNNYQYR